ncbi:hypothetical protein PPERSA_01713 [Pseudocohnilembus persalinus]|uniref:Uncharacterized protein n=1 Tax=Pseudocohnilembus persalinus TaxID=266149 RepID=A0A0V0Q7Q7_PSEPJ|nr:hypothetical protein PPERSA_01713 [Pseudocohnilembus persalinus]|eukprot:KRW98275.1 hypothetical protein PPERSA_01713 [Pseudocohnilembus persalinus]
MEFFQVNPLKNYEFLKVLLYVLEDTSSDNLMVSDWIQQNFDSFNNFMLSILQDESQQDPDLYNNDDQQEDKMLYNVKLNSLIKDLRHFFNYNDNPQLFIQNLEIKLINNSNTIQAQHDLDNPNRFDDILNDF